MRQSGVVDLPLHGGKCPQWLFLLMKRLAGNISELIVDEYGEDELLRRLSDPYYFQALGCALGFDWHSSGLTTTTTGALIQALKEKDLGSSLGIGFAGGKGKTSKKTPDDIFESADKIKLDEKKKNGLIRASKLSAKVDSSLLQDGFQLYHHTFFFTKNNWIVIQQGMNESNNYARRYHWISNEGLNFVSDPHEAIVSDIRTRPLNLVDKDIEETRKSSLDLINDNPIKLKKYLVVKRVNDAKPRCSCNSQTLLTDFNIKQKFINSNNSQEVLELPKEHFPKISGDLNLMLKAYEQKPEDYEELVLIRGMGAKNLRALAMISHLVYGTPISWRDPVKYSFAHGGKDGWPEPVDQVRFNDSIGFLKNTIKDLKINNKERQQVLKRLNRFYSQF
ncbi:MAG: DUF763 domain-containing protein [Nanoarchaeota archaeon]|nr:DUF763 domain-containing protein [Nanoarchaeota archaeon]